MATDAQDFADVETEFSDVCSAFTAYFEEYVASVFLEVVYVVDASCAQLEFNAASERRALVDFILENREDMFYAGFVYVAVKF